jgi:hypothetical protein
MNLTINGRQVTVDDAFRDLPREEQEAAVEHIASSMPPPEASGTAAGAVHGMTELYNGPAETLKRFAGVGPGRQELDPGYVPADVTHGSWNPAKWSLSQLPQKVAEMAPSMIPDIAAGAAGAKAGKVVGGVKGAAIGGILGAMLSGTARTAGDTAHEVTTARTGDANAESSTADLVRGGATAGAASAAGALLPARLIPGVNPVRTVGSQGALDAVKSYLGTGVAGGVGAVGQNAITQAGTTGTVDPSQFPEAAVGGAATGATLAAPRLAGDAIRSATLAKFGGENLEPAQNVATRLQAASEKLGNAKSDEAAFGTVVSDLRNELGDAAAKVRRQTQLSPEADNALTRAQRGDKITPAEVARIKLETAGAPDGDNTAFLAHSLHVADLMSERGGHSNRGWSGGLSGVMDKNLGFLLNPARLAGGAAATGLGMHLLGTSNPIFGGALAATYGTARAIDKVTGMRSPASTFVQHFAEQNAALRKPTTAPQAPPPQAPTPGPAQPWGPVPPMRTGPTGPSVTPPGAPQAPAGPWGPVPPPQPMAGPTGPQVAPPAPPAPKPPWQTPTIGEEYAGPNPIALAALRQKLKQGLPPEPAPAEPQLPQFNPMALAMLKDRIKENAAAPVREAQAQSQAEQAAAKAAQAQAAAEQKQQTQAERAQAKAEQARLRAEKAEAAVVKAKDKEAAKAEVVKARAAAAQAKEAAKLEQAKVQAAALLLKQATVKSAPASISKSNGKFKAAADETVARKPYEPIDDEYLYPKGITPQEYAAREAEKNGGGSVYKGKAQASETRRQTIANELIAKHPKWAAAIRGLHRQLQIIGNKPDEIADASHHYAEHVTDPEAAKALREAFR